MKRHEHLRNLSREHYGALKLAVDSKRAAASGAPERIEQAAIACRMAFESELEAHFRQEERELLPLLLGAGLHPLVRRTEADHARLRDLAARLAEPDGSLLLDFAENLTAHVRFEEREMFAAVELLLAPPA